MDQTERLYKLMFDLLLTPILALPLHTWGGLGLPWAILVAYLIAHTINLLINGQIWVVLKHFGLVKHTREDFDTFLASLAFRLADEPSIGYGAVYGSVVRENWNPTSDLDVRLIRYSGLWYGVRACTFVLRERAHANWARFPLDIYVLDSAKLLKRLRSTEHPIVIYCESEEHRLGNHAS